MAAAPPIVRDFLLLIATISPAPPDASSYYFGDLGATPRGFMAMCSLFDGRSKKGIAFAEIVLVTRTSLHLRPYFLTRHPL
jgi:hypothetical protein